MSDWWRVRSSNDLRSFFSLPRVGEKWKWWRVRKFHAKRNVVSVARSCLLRSLLRQLIECQLFAFTLRILSQWTSEQQLRHSFCSYQYHCLFIVLKCKRLLLTFCINTFDLCVTLWKISAIKTIYWLLQFATIEADKETRRLCCSCISTNRGCDYLSTPLKRFLIAKEFTWKRFKLSQHASSVDWIASYLNAQLSDTL